MRLGTVDFEVVDGSIVELEVDVIVNAANATLAGGGGVDGAIHRAAGPALKAACLALPEVRPGVRCPPGEMRVTAGFGLKAPWVFHTVGPVWRDGAGGEAMVLATCYRVCLEALDARGLAHIAFPAISTGAFGFPADEAARIAATECVRWGRKTTRPARVTFAVLGVSMTRKVGRALDAAASGP